MSPMGPQERAVCDSALIELKAFSLTARERFACFRIDNISGGGEA